MSLVVSAEQILADLAASPIRDIEAWVDHRDCVTPAVAAGILGMSPEAVARRADAGLIEAFRTPAGHRRYYTDSVYEYRRSRRGASPSPAGTAHAAPSQPAGRH